MKYYILKSAVGTKETGKSYPQSETMSDNYIYDSKNSLRNIYIDKLSGNNPNLDSLVIKDSSKITDLISSAVIDFGFVINDKLKNILEEVNLPLHKFYPASIVHKGKLHNNYFWFHFIYDVNEMIDYSKTTFYITDSFDERESVIIKNRDDMVKLKKTISTLKIIKSDSYILKSEMQYDMFGIGLFDFKCYMSEKLKELILSNNITGVAIADGIQIQL